MQNTGKNACKKGVEHHWKPVQSISNQRYLKAQFRFRFPAERLLSTHKHSRSYFPSDSNLRRLGSPFKTVPLCACMPLYTVNLMRCAWLFCPPLSVSFDLRLRIKHHTLFFFLLFVVVVDIADLTMARSLPTLTLHFAHRSWPIRSLPVLMLHFVQKSWPVHYQCKHCILCTETGSFTTSINTTFCTQKLPWNTTKIFFLSIKQIFGN